MTSSNGNDKTNASMDTELARVVVDRGLATRREVDDCLARQKELPSSSDTSPLADSLITTGAVTASQLGRIKLEIEESRKDRQIPNYQILAKLGSGAMATTFKARQLNLDRLVAIKILHPRLSENAEYVDRFYKEGRAAATLNHPNIAQAFDVGESKGWHYFVMEYVEGHTLYDEIAGGKTFTEFEAMEVILQIARALEHAHSIGLIHRDVKPKNIMMTNEGTAKLVDMGLARQISDDETAKAEAGKAFGTPYYISPEQIRGQLDIDSRADIYSLGATLYHMVTGQVPFEAETPTAVMHKHLKETLVPPDHINESLSSGIGEVVEVMMAKDRDRRYSSTGDLLMDLEAIAAGQPPLQARKTIDSGVLSGLAGGGDKDETIETQAIIDNPQRSMLPYIILLAGALGVSLMFNLLLLMQ
ncbi:MAG TPA: serine/threonine protein kinase [Phycisphaerae bacterium]|nr:serine/threonine protein kinase [Phycisphaerae bacterium]